MSSTADLYFKKINLLRYCDESCDVCKVNSFDEFVARLKSGELKNGLCPHWSEQKLRRFFQVVEMETALPRTPSVDVPMPAPAGMFDLNNPNESSPILLTGNSQFTLDVLSAVLSLTKSPFRLLCVDTRGDTVDMAMIYKTLTAKKVAEALEREFSSCVPSCRIILPGLAEPLVEELRSSRYHNVEVGPICAAELPLYMGDYWEPV